MYNNNHSKIDGLGFTILDIFSNQDFDRIIDFVKQNYSATLMELHNDYASLTAVFTIQQNGAEYRIELKWDNLFGNTLQPLNENSIEFLSEIVDDLKMNFVANTNE